MYFNHLGTVNNESTWKPINSVNLLRNNAKNSKLIIDQSSSLNQYVPSINNQNLKEHSSALKNKNYVRIKKPKTKYCQKSVSQKIEELTEDKKHLLVLQEELVKQEISQSAELHLLKMINLISIHDMKISNLKLKNDLLMKKILQQ